MKNGPTVILADIQQQIDNLRLVKYQLKKGEHRAELAIP